MKKAILFLIIFLSFSSQKSYATHALGGDLRYEQIAPNQYLITLRVYRDCNGINLNSSATVKWTGTCGNGNAVATRNSVLDITPLCPGLPTACGGGSGSIGIEQNIYTAIITVPAGCDDIIFNYSLCCRNHSITTLLAPGSEKIFLYSEHVNTSIVNQSPVFNNYPSPIVCVNQPVIYNHGVYDPDGDSLYFFQGNCYEALNDTVEYLPGYNGVTPLTTVNPIILNPNTGAISFTPNIQQVAVMCIVVQEFRNGILIGETIRDIQFNVIACSNIPPQASGVNNQLGVDSLDFMISVCQNSVICFDLSFSDIDLDVLTVSWNQEIGNGTFQVFNNNTIAPTGQFCWTPNASDLGLNFFSVNIKDDACPIVGNSTYTYIVQVMPGLNTINLSYDNSFCIVDTNQIHITSSPNPIDSVYWMPSPTLYQTSLLTADVYPNGATTYLVEAFFTNGCSVVDSVNLNMLMPSLVIANANTNNICNGGTIVLNGSGADSYTWNNGVIDGVAFVPPAGVSTYVVMGVDSNMCTNTDSVQISVSPILNIVALPSANICAGDEVTLFTSGASGYTWNNGIIDGVPFSPPVGTTTYILTGTDVNGCLSQNSIDITVNPLPIVTAMLSASNVCYGDSVVLNGAGAQSYLWDNGVNDGVAFVPIVGTTTYNVTGTDANGCVNQSSINSIVNASPNLTIAASAIGNTLCEGESLTLTASGASTYVWDNGVLDGISFIQAAGTVTYTVTGTGPNGCVNQDSIDITVNPLPIVTATLSANNVCYGDSIVLNGAGAQSYLWDNGVNDGVAFVPIVGTTTYNVTGTDANGCVNQSSINSLVNTSPNLTIAASAIGNTLCEGESLTLTASGASTYVWDNGVLDGISFIQAAGTVTYTVTGTGPNGCVNQDSIDITVNPLPIVTAMLTAINVCYGDSIVLNGAGAQSYLWDNGVYDGVAFVPIVGTTTYNVTGTDANGCVNQSSINSLVNTSPNLTIAASAIGNTLCEGESLTLTASGASTYVWDNGVNNGVAFVPPVGTTTYNVTDGSGCMNANSITILVNSLPPVSIVASTDGKGLCEGDTITLSGSGAQSYSWNNGVLNSVSFVPPVGTTTYIVTVIDDNGCVNQVSMDITLNPLPIVTAMLSANNVCDGDSVILNCSNLASHSWNYNVIDGVPFAPPVGTTTYVLTAMDFNGCINVDSIDIVVNPLPNVLANSTGNPVCIGTTVALFGSGATYYTWNNGVQNGLAFTPSESVSTYIVIGTDLNGCNNEDDIDIEILNMPVVNPASSNNNVCEGEAVILTGSGAESYTWNNGVVNGVPFVPAVGVNSYVLTGLDGNACSSSDTIEVTVHPLPNVLANASSTAICDGEAISLYGSGAFSYVWDNGINDGDSLVPNMGLNIFMVTGTDVNGCMNNDTIAIMTNISEELNAMEDLVVCDLDFIDLETNSTNIIGYQWGIIESGVASTLSNSINYIGVNTSQLHLNDLSGAVNYTFYVELTGVCGNILFDTINLTANQAPQIDVLQDTSLCIHESNVIFADLVGANLTWSDGTLGQYLYPEYPGMYYITYEENGTNCLVSDTMYIEMEECADACFFIAPTGFSPNGDGTNDGFKAIHTCDEGLSQFDMKVYDRWGSLVFQTSDPEVSWDGTYKGELAPIATYSFIINYTIEYNDERENLTGNVSLIR